MAYVLEPSAPFVSKRSLSPLAFTSMSCAPNAPVVCIVISPSKPEPKPFLQEDEASETRAMNAAVRACMMREHRTFSRAWDVRPTS